MPGRGGKKPGASGRAAVPLAAVTRRQARLTTPGSPNRFQLLEDPPEPPPEAPTQSPRTPRPRANSAPPTPDRGLPPTATAPEAPSASPTSITVNTGSPVRTRDMPLGPGPRPDQRTVAFSLPRAPEELAEAAPFYEAVRNVADKVDLLIKEVQALYPEEASVLGSLTDLISAFARFLEPRPESPDQEPQPRGRPQSLSSLSGQSSQSQPLQRSLSRASQSSRGSATYAAVAARPPPSLRPATTKPDTPAPTVRAFLRLPPDHPLREADPSIVRSQANAVPEAKDLFTAAYPIPSGFTLLARSPAALAIALEAQSQITVALNATALEGQEAWDPYLLSPVPRHLRGLDGPIEVTASLVREEINIVLGLTPRHAAWTRRTAGQADPEGEMVVYFPRGSTPPTPRLWLFGRQALLRPIRKARPSLTPCPTCLQYHGAGGTACRRTPRCNQCSQAHASVPEPCTHPARCVNCRGPHPSTTPDCPARPRQDNRVIRRLDRKQLRAVRSAGARAWRSQNGQAPTTDSDSSAQQISSIDSSGSEAGALIIPIRQDLPIAANYHPPKETSTLTPGPQALAANHPPNHDHE
jgi:hypothetical protein